MQTSRLPRVIALTLKASVGLGALAIAVAIYAGLVATKPHPKTIESERKPVLVNVVPATRAMVTRHWEGFGTAQPMDSADVSAQVTARVIERGTDIEPGYRIKENDIIIRLDQADYEHHLEAARQIAASINADLAALDIERTRLDQRIELASEELGVRRREYERAMTALEEGAGNTTEVEARLAQAQRIEREMIALEQQADLIPPRRARLNAQLAGANADIKLAQENLDRTEIRSPITGTIQSVEPEVGELLSLGQAVARIVDLTRLEVPLRLPASSASDIGPGAAVTLRPDGPSPTLWRGNVSRIAPESDPNTRMVTVYVEVQRDNSAFGSDLMPGRFVVGRVASSNTAPRIIIPRNTVRKGRVTIATRAGDAYQVAQVQVEVLFYLNGIQPGIDPGETQWAVIGSGLAEGDQIILDAQDLTAGQAVRIQSLATAQPQTTPTPTPTQADPAPTPTREGS